MARRRSRNARRVVVVNRPRRRRSNPYRRHRRRSIARANPSRRRFHRHNARRHYRRNPSRAGAIALTRPLTWVPVLLTGGLAATVSSMAPHLVLAADATPTQTYALQAGVAAAGAVLLPMAGLRGAHVVAWIVGATAPIVAHFVTDKLAAMLGLSWYPYQALGQHPAYPPRLYGTAGADMYPYEGGQPMWDYEPQARTGAPESPFEHMYNT